MKADSIHKTQSISLVESLVVISTLFITLFSQLFMPFVLGMNSIENILYIPLIYILITSSRVNIKLIPVYFHFLLVIALTVGFSNFYNHSGVSGFLFALRPIKYYILSVAIFSFYQGNKTEFKQVLNAVLLLAIAINVTMLFNPFGWGVSLLKWYSNHIANYELNTEITKNFRLFGTFNSPNDNAVFWGLILIFVTSVKSFFERNFRLLIIICSIFFIVFTQSRTSIIAIIFATSLLFIIHRFNVKTMIIIAVTLLLGYVILINSGLSYLKQLSSFDITKIQSLTSRYDAWEACMELWMENKSLGIGNQKSAYILSGYHPDSEYIYLLVTGGVALLFAYVLFFIGGFVHSVRTIKNNPNSLFIIGASTFLLVNGVTNYSFVNPEIAILFVTLTAITCSTKKGFVK